MERVEAKHETDALFSKR